MSSAVAVAVRCTVAANERDLKTLVELSTDDVEIVPMRAALEDTQYHGPEGIAQWLRDNDETWAELYIELDETLEPAPDVAMGVGRILARGHASDAPTTTPVVLVAWLRDGLLAKVVTFTDREVAERAIAAEPA